MALHVCRIHALLLHACAAPILLVLCHGQLPLAARLCCTCTECLHMTAWVRGWPEIFMKMLLAMTLASLLFSQVNCCHLQ